LEISDSDLKELKEKLKILTKDKKPSSYYAVILLDGDNMGKWLSGEKLPPIEMLITQKFGTNFQTSLRGI